MILIFLYAFLIFALRRFLYNAHKQIRINERRRKMKHPVFIDEYGSFSIEQPENTNYLYFPLASENGLKSSVTPNLGGDSKIDQETFLMEPVSAENLHNNKSVRNFWLVCEPGKIFSATGSSAEQEAAKFTPEQDGSKLTAGFMWHTLERVSPSCSVSAQITSFIPVEDNAEIMYITIRNLAAAPRKVTPYAAIPIYGRSADNIRDHRNVTSMLHRIRTTADGVLVRPTMSFDERGHRPNHPRAVYEDYPGVPAQSHAAGREAMGAFRFPEILLDPGEEAEYILLLGVEDSVDAITEVFEKYNTADKVRSALERTRTYWREKVNTGFSTGNTDLDCFMKWVCFQPFLRRLFGCSFLPHHDYGRGGRGWRDLWQDCLSLLLMDPDGVGQMIEKNFGGVRIDGTNATIIGDGDGSFIADRNGISRVWMDHALWPQMTTKLYIDQTGDIDILNKQVPYFKDAQSCRGTTFDPLWDAAQGSLQRTKEGAVYSGSILEHLLIQQLVSAELTGMTRWIWPLSTARVLPSPMPIPAICGSLPV